MAGVIALTAGGLGGGVIVVLGAVARQIRREDRLYSLGEDAPGALARRARRLNGFGRRGLYAQVRRAERRVAA
jgi:hypothetical protein